MLGLIVTTYLVWVLLGQLLVLCLGVVTGFLLWVGCMMLLNDVLWLIVLYLYFV